MFVSVKGDVKPGAVALGYILIYTIPMFADSNAVFIGIDPGSGRGMMVYVALDADKRILAIGGGKLSDVLAFAAGQSQALAAVHVVSIPRKEPDKMEVQQQLFADCDEGVFGKARREAAEWIENPQSVLAGAYRERESRSARQRANDVLHQLQQLNYQSFPRTDSSRQWLRVSVTAAYTALTGGRLFESRSLEGRLQRQLALYQEKLPVRNPLDFFEEITGHRLLLGKLPFEMLYAPPELNALAAAYTAWLAVFEPQRVIEEEDPHAGMWFLPLRPSPAKE
ncbi:MAG: hypothetical protein AB1453_07060 [Chloroflexota bacterium]